MNKLMIVETIKPPITAIPIGARKEGSPAQPIAIGVMPAIMAIVVFATFSLDFNLDWDTYTVERWPAQALPIAIGTLAAGGPVLLLAHWLLFRAERAHGP